MDKIRPKGETMPYTDSKTLAQRIALLVSKFYLGEKLSKREIAELFNISPRSADRYVKNYLIPAGIPLVKNGDRWELKMVTKKDFLFSLQIIKKMAEQTGILNSNNRYIKSCFNLKTDETIFTKIEFEDITDKLEIVSLLSKAIDQKLEVKITYITKDNIKKDYILKPYKILNFFGKWYLLAQDRKVLKNFSITKIQHANLTEKKFLKEKSIEKKLNRALSIWFDPNETPFEIRLFADKIATNYLKQQKLNDTQMLFEDEDGSSEISLKITNYMEIVPFIQSWLPHIKVIEPYELQEIIIGNILDYLEEVAPKGKEIRGRRYPWLS